MGDPALADAPAKPFAAKPKITKGKGKGKWQQQRMKKEGAYDSVMLIPGWQTGRVWLGAHVTGQREGSRARFKKIRHPEF